MITLDDLAGEVERVSALLQASRADEAHCIRERDRLKAALEFYADENNWRDQPFLRMDHLGCECEDYSPAEMWVDNGDRARKALGDAS